MLEAANNRVVCVWAHSWPERSAFDLDRNWLPFLWSNAMCDRLSQTRRKTLQLVSSSFFPVDGMVIVSISLMAAAIVVALSTMVGNLFFISSDAK